MIASAGLFAASAFADVFTIAGVTFDTDNSAQSAAIVEGNVTIRDNSSKVFARIELAKGPKADDVNPYLTFDRGRSVGRLLGRAGRHADDRARYISFPEKGLAGPQPNKDRVTVELTWGKQGIKNGDGPDFVVYEVGSYEPFSVAVRKVGSTEWSFYRYQFAKDSDSTHGVNSVVFDLAAFGVAPGEIVDAIRIRNIFNSEAVVGEDRVDNSIGEGRVIYPTDLDYLGAKKLRSQVNGDEVKTEFLDADIIYVAALHKIVPLGAAARSGAGSKSSN